MAKYSFQDIRTPRRRAAAAAKKSAEKEKIEKVVPQKVEGLSKRETKEKHDEQPRQNISAITPPPTSRTREVYQDTDYSRFGVWFVAVVAVIILIVSFGGLFAGATVTITPKQETSVINGTFSTSQDAGEADVSHEVMILSDEESMEVPATEEKEVSRRASGTIVVYNKHSSSSQKLVTRTRFETPDGKIYRIKGSIIVPGTKVENGEIIPGSIEVKVYADDPGEEYNIGLTDFTIPGFEGDPRFKTFYARSKTEMTGGFLGTLRYPSDEEMERAVKELKNILSERFGVEAKAQKPDNFVLYDDALFVEFDDIGEDFESKGDTVTITQRAVLHAIIFKTDDFAKFIASQSLASFDGSGVSILGIEELEFSIEDKDYTSALDDEITINISGNVHILWDIDHEALKQRLIGVSKKKFKSILSEFPDIKNAKASIRPFWKRAFPDKSKDIRIEETIEG
ncbi:hypothetical protein ACFLY0_02515 [Patescibacteria group bacterium]